MKTNALEMLIASVLYDGILSVATASSQATGSMTNTDQESIKHEATSVGHSTDGQSCWMHEWF